MQNVNRLRLRVAPATIGALALTLTLIAGGAARTASAAPARNTPQAHGLVDSFIRSH